MLAKIILFLFAMNGMVFALDEQHETSEILTIFKTKISSISKEIDALQPLTAKALSILKTRTPLPKKLYQDIQTHYNCFIHQGDIDSVYHELKVSDITLPKTLEEQYQKYTVFQNYMLFYGTIIASNHDSQLMTPLFDAVTGTSYTGKSILGKTCYDSLREAIPVVEEKKAKFFWSFFS